MNSLPRISLAHLPTPLDELVHLSKVLGGPRLLMKRDDQTGFAMGGNKVRKLEFLLADALRNRADTVIAAGAAQSNHCRQTAAAAARAGLSCHLVLGGEQPKVPGGNLLLDHLFGASIHWTGMERRGERMNEIADELKQRGARPYMIPYGGSNATGAAGFVAAVEELVLQTGAGTISHIVLASSSGGTHAGVAVGVRATGFTGTVIGIRIDKDETSTVSYEQQLADLSNATALHVGIETGFEKGDFHVNYNYLGKGYGVVGDAEIEALRLLARTEGIVLDPVYTARAMAGLIDLIRNKELTSRDTVLFWHTGGAPALFSYAETVASKLIP
jgi:D-cysteine desulfhydrase family pyridoxal phosphate-dependent enzyme